MDSPRPPLTSPTLSTWVHPFKPLHKALSIVVLSLLCAALVFSSLPLWMPMAALLLQKLLGFLKLLVVTTGIALGILNSRLWRSTYTEKDSVTGNGGEDCFSSKVPFVGMYFSSEMQHSYTLDEKEMEVSEKSRSEPEEDGAHHASAVTMGGTGAAGDGEQNTRHTSMCVIDSTSGVPIKEGIAYHERDDSVEKSAQHGIKEDGPSIHVPANIVMNGATKTKVKPFDDLGLATVVAQQPEQSSKIIHRRGSSLDFPIEQVWDDSKLGNYAATDQQCVAGKKLSSSRKAPSSSDLNNMVDHHPTEVINPSSNGPKKAIESSSRHDTGAGFPAVSTSMSKHNRSRSAYDLNEPQQTPGSKSGTISQLSRRRNVSLSCDLDKDYSKCGAPAWLPALPSPPEPPLIYGFENRVVTTEFDMRQSERQDESSLRKAFSESLAPWRAATNAMPVNISSSMIHKEASQRNKHPSTKRSTLEKTILTPPSSPSTPNSFNTMGSPSPGELNKKVDAFIARFHQQMRLQRLESLERSKQRGH